MTLAPMALGFSGSGPFVTLGTAEALALQGGDFTVEAWVRPLAGSLGGQDFALLGNDTPTLDRGLHLEVRDGRLHFGFHANDTPGNTPLVAGTWYHLAFRYSSANGGEQALFLNGVLDAVGSPRAPFQGTGPVHLGKCFGAGFWNGQITELRIWREARSERQIQANLYRRLTGSEPRLAGYWPLDEGTGELARDARVPIDEDTRAPLPESRITRNHGQIHGAQWAPSTAPILTLSSGTEAAVVVAEFDGVSSYIAVKDAPSLAVKDALTVEAWVRATGAGKPSWSFPVVSRHGGQAGWELRAAAGEASFIVALDRVYHEATATGLEPGVWYHLAAVFDGLLLRLHVNGVLKTSVTAAGTITPYPAELSIGRNSYWPERMFAGQIAEVRLWNRARSQAEIQQSLFTRLSGQESGLVGVWQLEGNGRDTSPGRNVGVQRGALRWAVSGPPLPAVGDAVLPATDDPEKLKGELLRRQQDIQALLAALQATNAQLDDFKRQVAALTAGQDQLAARAADLQRQLDARRGAAEALEHSQARVAELNGRVLEIAKGGGAQTSLQDFVKQSNEEITRAREELRRQGSNYSLGRVAIEVKMLPGPAGVGMRFPQGDELKTLDAAHLSTLNLDFEARDTREERQETRVLLPSLLGYTEVMARRKLAELGLLVEISYQAVVTQPGEPVQADRVVNQYPRQGSQVPVGTSITIFIGRSS